MPRHPDKYYQRFTKPYCECEADDHGHSAPCKSRRYLVVHHKDHARQDQSRENLITLCSSCHRKEHREQSFYSGRLAHRDWANRARTLIAQAQIRKEMAAENEPLLPEVITDDDEP